MNQPRRFRIVESASSSARLADAAAYLDRFPPHRPINIVAAARGAADDLARRVAVARGSTVGLARYSVTQCAARVAATRLAGVGLAPATALGSEAVAARAAFEAREAGVLEYFGGVVRTPGFARALSQTLGALRAAGLMPESLAAAGESGHDLASLMTRAGLAYENAATADRVRLFEVAAAAAVDDPTLAAPLLLLDVAIESPSEETFIAALVSAATEACATIPVHDEHSCEALQRAGGVRERLEATGDTDLDSLRTYLFSDESPPERGPDDGSVDFFSAPGEGRECVEIARRILGEARRGVRFDEMAVLVRSPDHYQGLLEHALARAQVPAWFDRGTRRPHPAGRAFLALLRCAAEGLSARRFAEYLSLGQVPAVDSGAPEWQAAEDELLVVQAREDVPSIEAEVPSDSPDEDDDRVRSGGTLVTPRGWERLFVEAAVIGGDPARWIRRLGGLAGEFAARRVEAKRDDPGSARVAGLERDEALLALLRAFAEPLISDMAGWPRRAPWGDWLDRLERLAPRVLRQPDRVLGVLAALRPMSAVGPVGLEEVRSVLEGRLLAVQEPPPARRYGRVLVAGPEQVRGRCFRTVFIPGLAERMFPQKLSQDPLLLDEARSGLERRLDTGEDRGRRERLLLHLCVGAASERLHVSYPRLDVWEARVRVPSFYGLDLLRGARGRVPDHEALSEAAVQSGDATLAWPAPRDAARAIDEQEHDLAVLRGLLDEREPDRVRGHAHYLLRLNPALRRAVVERWARGERRWSHFDGLIRVTDGTRAALTAQRLEARPYSLSALQRFAACPYQFLLAAVYRLDAARRPAPLQRLDPLTRGSLVHRVQAELFRALEHREALPVTGASLEHAHAVLREVMARVESAYREALMPAIDRVWDDEIEAVARDLRGWLQRVASEGERWMPRYFEWAFGLPLDEHRDPRSVEQPVVIGGRFTLRGAVDLVEEHHESGSLRVTDHKTGKNRSRSDFVVGGGTVLQPVLYSLVVEAATGKPVVEGRLSFCTTAGGFSESVVTLSDDHRRRGLEVLEVIDRAIEHGELAPAPADGACARCGFTSVCGRDEEARVARKPHYHLRDLQALRSRP